MRNAITGALVALLLACATGYGERQEARQALESGRVEDAVQIQEAVRQRYPNSPDVRNELGEAYYQRARKALDERRLDDYERDLGLALNEWIESVRLEPTSPIPHNWMGIVAAYQGDLASALTNFRNARRLDPLSPVYALNIAQTYIYQGELSKARHYIRKAQGLRAPLVDLEMLSMLAAWRADDMVETLDLFEGAYALDPEGVNRFAGDAAEVPEPLTSFDEYAAYCCGNPGCGPYMEQACHRQKLAVKQREIDEETVRRELVLEMERRRRLEEIYRQRRDLKIEVDPVEEPEKP
jgi:tetratricopeptide (TPR) repeat protein